MSVSELRLLATEIEMQEAEALVIELVTEDFWITLCKTIESRSVDRSIDGDGEEENLEADRVLESISRRE